MQDFNASEAILGGSSAFLPSGKAEEQKAVQPHSANFLHSMLPLLNLAERGCGVFMGYYKRSVLMQRR